MKLRYYLRGLGIGIVVTTLIFLITPGQKETLSNAEIRERAEQLGMVDSSSLTLSAIQGAAEATADGSEAEETFGTEESADTAEIPESTDITETAEFSGMADVSESTDAAAMAEDSLSEDTAGETEGFEMSDILETEGSGMPETAESGENQPVQESTAVSGAEPVTVTIERGTNSEHVSELLQEAGLIGDAAVFNDYLCDNGYSRSITAGTYEIIPGVSQDEIAEIITTKR